MCVCVCVEEEGDVDHFESLLGDGRSGREEEGSGEEGEGSEEEGEWESGSQSVDEENPEEVEDMGVSHNSAGEGKPLLFSSQQDDTTRGQAVARQISE